MNTTIYFLCALLAVANACYSSGACGYCRSKARAKSSKTLNGDNFVKQLEEDTVYGLSLWNKTSIDAADENKNRYTMENMFTRSHSCPIDFLPEMQFCAAQGMNHRQCCSSRGVDQSAAGEKCLTFCDQRPDKFTPIDYSYAPCFERFEDMKRCFYDDVKQKATEKFDPLLANLEDNLMEI